MVPLFVTVFASIFRLLCATRVPVLVNCDVPLFALDSVAALRVRLPFELILPLLTNEPSDVSVKSVCDDDEVPVPETISALCALIMRLAVTDTCPMPLELPRKSRSP